MTDADSQAEHERCRRALPWLVNGTLSPEHVAQLERHLEHCLRCAEDLQTERTVQEQLRAGDAVLIAPQSGWQRMTERLHAADEALARGVDGSTQRSGPWRWAVAAQAVLIVALLVALGGSLTRNEPGDVEQLAARMQPRYETLTATPVATVPQGAVRVVFREGVTVADMNGLLRQTSVQIIAGPTEANVYTLGVTVDGGDASVAAALAARLRADARVVFAEPAHVERLHR